MRSRLNERLRSMTGDQRRLAALLLILVVVATGFAGHSLLGAGHASSSSSRSTTAPRHAATALESAPATRAAAPPTTTGVVQLSAFESLRLFENRDPFQPAESPIPPAPARSATPATGSSLALIEVFTDATGQPRAQVRVGATVDNVGVGDVFAVSYKVISLRAPCGQFLFGDSSFQLCAGQEMTK